MQFKEIKIGELPGFVEGELWQELSPKPITALRALSQSHNPRANADDIALIIAWEENTLAGLAGILPNQINGQPDQPASSNTCWWVHPDKGRQLAFPLFLRAFASCGQRMFMTDCTPHTLSILEKTSWFEFPQTPAGTRGFLKFNLHEVLPLKMPSTRKIKPLLKLGDQTLNRLSAPYWKRTRNRFIRNIPHTEYLASLSQNMYRYIESHSTHEFIRRGGKDLEWILRYPWIKAKEKEQAVDYPFSQFVESFEQYFIRITQSDQTIGLLLISIKNGHMKVPYAWFDDQDARQVIRVIYQQAQLKNVVTLTIFNPRLVNAMDSMAHPFIFRKKIKRQVAISKQLSALYHQYPQLQDGDGDVVFT